MNNSEQKITTFLMFSGNAKAAMNFYISLFDQSEVISITHYKENEAGKEGSVMHAKFSLKGQEFMCIDSSVEQGFTFTPAMSLYVTCGTEDEINKVFEKLSEGGKILMPLGSYPFSERFAWVNDKYGVSWQLAFEKK